MQYRSNGKLLLTGEYLVLDGAKALAAPTVKGQVMRVNPALENGFEWRAIDHNGQPWLQFNFVENQEGWLEAANSNSAINQVLTLLNYIKSQKPSLFSKGLLFESILDFPRDWGLGSSSTFVANLAQWSGVDGHDLLKQTSAGSGYDVAAALRTTPFMYQLVNGQPTSTKVTLDFPFSEELFFVHLGLKQNSEGAIAFYNQKRSRKKTIAKAITQIDEISSMLPFVSTLQDFEEMITAHEDIMAELLGMKKAKDALFENYPGAIKSLGAWGGDFILATGASVNKAYFEQYGLNTIIAFDDLLMHASKPSFI